MARTKKGSKPSGFEFWGTRPMVYSSGTFAKILCRRIERQQSKELVRKELDQL